MKKNLFILESLTNLMIAIKIRSMYKSELFDIVIPSHVRTLVELKDKGLFDSVFDHVFCADYNSAYNVARKLKVILDIKKGIRLYFGCDISNDYSDLFFWNPSELFFVLNAYFNFSNADVRVHIYADAFGGYIVDSPDSPQDYAGQCWDDYPVFKNGFWNVLFKTRYRTRYVRDMDYDFYMMKADLSIIKRNHAVVEIPSLDLANDLELINHVYNYRNDNKIDYRWIVLTNVWGERHDVEIEKRILQEVITALPSVDTIIKPHPRYGAEFFGSFNVNVIEADFPLELYLMNNNVEDKVFISDESSAILFSALVLDIRITVIWIRALYDGSKIYDDELWKYYNRKMVENGCKIFEPKTEKELRTIINLIFTNMEKQL